MLAIEADDKIDLTIFHQEGMVLLNSDWAMPQGHVDILQVITI